MYVSVFTFESHNTILLNLITKLLLRNVHIYSLLNTIFPEICKYVWLLELLHYVIDVYSPADILTVY